MKKVFLLSALILCFSGFIFSQETKGQKQNPKVQSNDSKGQTKVSKDLTTEKKNHHSEWDKKLILELSLTEPQIAKLDALNKEYEEKLTEIKLESRAIEKKQSSDVALVHVESPSSQSARVSETDIPKGDAEANAKNAEFEEKKIALNNEKEKLFIELLTPKQVAKYKEMIEQKELIKKEGQADKHPPKEPLKQVVEIEQ